jgi:hypothetical protein
MSGINRTSRSSSLPTFASSWPILFVKICRELSPTRRFVRRFSDMTTDLLNLSNADRRKRSDRNYNESHDPSPPSALGRTGSFAGGSQPIDRPTFVRVETFIWIACCLLTILGLAKAAASEQPFLWMALWPAPVVIAFTVFTFLRQGFHFKDGVLILGRPQG